MLERYSEYFRYRAKGFDNFTLREMASKQSRQEFMSAYVEAYNNDESKVLKIEPVNYRDGCLNYILPDGRKYCTLHLPIDVYLRDPRIFWRFELQGVSWSKGHEAGIIRNFNDMAQANKLKPDASLEIMWDGRHGFSISQQDADGNIKKGVLYFEELPLENIAQFLHEFGELLNDRARAQLGPRSRSLRKREYA